LVSQLLSHYGLNIVDEHQLATDVVAVVVADQMDEETGATIRALKRRGVERVVVIVARVDDTGLLSALEAGVRSILRRTEATPDNLVKAIRAAASGEGTMSRICWAASWTRLAVCRARC
jgi:DNA-binding NarL/FixJ family response regulator